MILGQAFVKVANEQGTRAVQIKGNKLWYESLQVLLETCICKYKYAASAKSKVLRAAEVPVLGDVSQWLHAD